jgi:hypothetical protein
MLHDNDRLFDNTGRSFVIKHNLKGNSIDQWTKQYRDNEAFRKRKRKDSVFVTHEVISFHREDAKNLSLDKLELIAREYINLRNPKGIYVGVPHFNTGCYHIHFAVSGIAYRSGESLRLSKQELLKLKKGIQAYQLEKFPELSKSVVEHGKNLNPRYSEKEYQYKRRTARESDKGQVIGMLKTFYKKASSREDFFEMLKESSLTSYSRGGKLTGVLYQGRKFRLGRLGFTDERLNELDKSFRRGKELQKVRERGIGKSTERDIER